MRDVQVKRLSLRSMVLVHVDGEYEDRILARFADELRAVTGLPVAIIPKGISLESVDEEEMRKAGWVRANHKEDTS